MASGTAAAAALVGCSEDEESDSPARGGGETETQGAPQEPANGSTRGSGTRTEVASQREGAEDVGGTGDGEGDAGGETPEADGESPAEGG